MKNTYRGEKYKESITTYITTGFERDQHTSKMHVTCMSNFLIKYNM